MGTGNCARSQTGVKTITHDNQVAIDDDFDDSAIDPHKLSVLILREEEAMGGAPAFATVSRTPYNLASAISALVAELEDVSGNANEWLMIVQRRVDFLAADTTTDSMN